jgi:hypothetical protein
MDAQDAHKLAPVMQAIRMIASGHAYRCRMLRIGLERFHLSRPIKPTAILGFGASKLPPKPASLAAHPATLAIWRIETWKKVIDLIEVGKN